MTIEDLHSAFLDRPEIKAAIKELKRGGETHLLLSGLHASARALAIEAMARSSEYRVQSQELKVKSQESRVFFVIIDNEEDAKYLYADLVQIGCTKDGASAYRTGRALQDGDKRLQDC